MYLGIDIGGTFTDLVLMDDEGRLTTAKSLTTPGRLEEGVFNAIQLVADERQMGVDDLLGSVVAFGHGTTQATNALIERDGAITGLITTKGFGDTLALQRLMGFTAGVPVSQLGWYSRRRHPSPIVPRRYIREIGERVDQAGNILVPMDDNEVRQSVEELSVLDVETMAVALLWSFRNPEHERRVGDIVREMMPDAFVSLSCEVAPIIGEYERMATTALNSYLAPKVVEYLERVEGLLRDRGFQGTFNVLNSAGGVVPAKEAARKPVLLVASGPTGGVMGSIQLAKSIGEQNIITTDMGGTSFDVAIIGDGKPHVSATREVGGLHLNSPMIDIRAVGSGGGSVASVNGGLLRVGPESAGAKPGPVCYGQGGKTATVTDADVVLGIIDADRFLGGRMKLDREAAFEAIREQIATPLGVSVEHAAAGIRNVVDGQMADTLREVTIGRGYDPRDFTLFVYGGAGPMHCAGFGADLGVKRVVIPATSMAHSAYGALAADIHQSAERSMLLNGGGGPRDLWDGIEFGMIAEVFSELEAECAELGRRAGVSWEHVELKRTVDMRYRAQVHDLMIPFPDGQVTEGTVKDVVTRFETAYEAVYGRGAGFREAGIELTTFRVEIIGRTPKPEISGPLHHDPPEAENRDLFEPSSMAWMSSTVFPWASLPVGYEVEGPSVIEHPETTVFVGLGQMAKVDQVGNLVIDI